MADKQSRESIVETKVSDGVNESSIRMASKEITLKVGVDVSDAITGLKAVQREAKKASQELKSMSANGFRISSEGTISLDGGNIYSNIFTTSELDGLVLAKMTTEQLSEELARREGVSMADFYKGTEFKFDGPGRIILIEK